MENDTLIPAIDTPAAPVWRQVIQLAKKRGCHYAVYNDKEVPMDYINDGKKQFNMACHRITDNGAKIGYVVTPKGKVFEVTASSRRAKPVN